MPAAVRSASVIAAPTAIRLPSAAKRLPSGRASSAVSSRNARRSAHMPTMLCNIVELFPLTTDTERVHCQRLPPCRRPYPRVARAERLLGDLKDNGGATKTIALRRGRPAIDKANPDTAPARDQRGVLRHDPDIGA